MALPTFQGALKDGFTEAVMVFEMPKPCMLQVENAQISSGFWFWKDPFSTVSSQGPCFTATEEDADDKRLLQLELAWEADGVAQLDPLAIAAIAEAILIWTSAEQVPSLHGVASR